MEVFFAYPIVAGFLCAVIGLVLSGILYLLSKGANSLEHSTGCGWPFLILIIVVIVIVVIVAWHFFG